MLKLLESSGVFIHLDPRRDGVTVPNWFRQKPELVLQVGLNLVVPIPDLEVDDEGVFCTLSFSRTPFYCRLPWHAIFALRSDDDGRGVAWPEDAPRESQLAKAGGQKAGPPGPQRGQRPKLRAVGADETAEAAAAAEAAEAGGAETGGAEAEAPEIDGTCGDCGVRWSAGQTSCPVCGAGTGSFVAEGASEPATATEPEGATDAAVAAESAGASHQHHTTEPQSTAAPEGAAGEAASAGEASPKRASEPPAGDEPKPKRELPPYLRVVK